MFEIFIISCLLAHEYLKCTQEHGIRMGKLKESCALSEMCAIGNVRYL